ncbi:MAG: hypothetical protein QOJ09_875 [Actinomycetota bacterium]|nr:hypothetical protein [Actinomycetota bacterium]
MSPLAVRLGAIVAAVAMVVGALVLRARLDDNRSVRNQELRLTCATELDEVCRDFADTSGARVVVTVEDAGVTADKVASATEAPFDGWLTPGPFPQMVQGMRQAAGRAVLIDRVSKPIARTRTNVVMWKERAAALASVCPGKVIGWTCLGNAASRQWKDVGGPAAWGDVKTSIPDPNATASGLVALGGATVAFAGQSDVSSTQLDQDDAFGVWLGNLKRSQVPSADLGRMLTAGPSLVDVVAGLEAQTLPTLQGAARANEVTVIYPSPVVTADVVLGTVASKRATRLAELLEGKAGRDALQRAGWKVGSPSLPPTSGLPDPGLLAYLRGAWSNAG